MKFETILYEIENKILTITLNRPEKLNAFTGQMMDDLIKAFDQAGKDDGIRVIVLTGAGRGFCAGADLSAGQDTFNREIRNNKKYKLMIGDKSVYLLREDLLIDSIPNDGLSSNGDDNITVGFTLKLDKNLIMEGHVRDIIRQVQTMRKNANFAVEDRIKIYMNINNTIKDAICSFETLFKNEVLATEIYYEFNKGDFSDKFVIDGEEVKFGLERVNI